DRLMKFEHIAPECLIAESVKAKGFPAFCNHPLHVGADLIIEVIGFCFLGLNLNGRFLLLSATAINETQPDPETCQQYDYQRYSFLGCHSGARAITPGVRGPRFWSRSPFIGIGWYMSTRLIIRR